jgi:NAD(P)H-dependent FMN reductase
MPGVERLCGNRKEGDHEQDHGGDRHHQGDQRPRPAAHRAHNLGAKRADAEFELMDLRDFDLPSLDDAMSAAMGRHSQPHTRKWAAKIASFDAYVFMTPEYNHSTSGVLKNAIDFRYAEWNNKASGFISYGMAGGSRAVEHLRLA